MAGDGPDTWVKAGVPLGGQCWRIEEDVSDGVDR